MKLLPVLTVVVLVPALATADSAVDGPAAARRTNAENFKDRVLATCIAAAYKDAPPAAADAAATASALNEWAYVDLQRAGAAPDALVDRFLRRDYRNPTEGYANARFDLLKCLDLYHSRELEAQARAFVPHPDWLGDKPPKRESRR